MTRNRSLVGLLSSYALPVLLIAALVGFSAALPGTFASITNFMAIADGQTVVILLALAGMLPLIVGEFDLSVAGNTALGNILVVGLYHHQHLPPWLCVVLTLGAGALIGLANAVIVVRFQVGSFVGTLGMTTLLGGVGLLYSGGVDVYSVPTEITDIARGAFADVPLPIFYTALIGLTVHLVLSRMVLGRRMYAVGANRRAAELMGIATRRHITGAFVAAGLISGVAGVILGAQLGAASVAPNTATVLLPAFSAVFLGSTTIQPGRFNVAGTVVAACFLAVTVSGLQQIGVAAWAEPVLNGLTLVGAVALSMWALRVKTKRARSEQLRTVGEPEQTSQNGRIRDAV